MSALALVDGNVLNDDFDLYLSIVGEREKRIGLGSYGDGADRARPTLNFANPLGAAQIHERPTLIHPLGTLGSMKSGLERVYEVVRTRPQGEPAKFFAYRIPPDVPRDHKETVLTDPFPTPARETRTRPRGRFRLPFRV